MKESKKKKKITIILIILAAVVVIVLAILLIPKAVYHSKIINNVKQKAQELGIENCSASIKVQRLGTGMSRQIVTVKCSNFDTFSDSEKLQIAIELDEAAEATSGGIESLRVIKCKGIKYDYDESYGALNEQTLLCNGQVVAYVKYQHDPNYNPSSGTSSNYSSGKSICPYCNGTGSVKYYYGDSSWDAALNGKNDYEFGPCYSCHGTGYRN